MLLQDSIEQGYLGGVRLLLNDRDFTELLLRSGMAADLETAHLWMKMATAHEIEHGPESMLDPEHPFNRDHRSALRAELAEIRAERLAEI